MRRYAAALVTLAFAVAVHGFFLWGCGRGFESRTSWVPFLYAASIAGILLFSLLAFGSRKTQSRLEACGLLALFQLTAAGACILRQPGHALSAETIMLYVTVPALVIAFVCLPDYGKASRALRWPALLVLAGFPPLPGFFARIELFSAMIHAELPWLAVWTAVAQVAAAACVVQIIFEERTRKDTAPA